jgi:hypothetical protein
MAVLMSCARIWRVHALPSVPHRALVAESCESYQLPNPA